ncbi:hypothetical protein MtrunA17_Chr3g0096271 [Medicago truncatula]|uniref:Uncharacterized protein n=1 Tax=Medicago truncatula TaxID=3880 RepID=G7IXI7_MEDTR|nr:hypothetical protein MTR_3g047450 [Medicago truncatula]RHN66853.1 hypothetical protein MtrunA17_Chr3g0096271 [Medicago truncatula]
MSLATAVKPSSLLLVSFPRRSLLLSVGNHKPQSPVLLLKRTKSYLILRWRKLTVFGNE